MSRKVTIATVSMAMELRKVSSRDDNLNYIAETVGQIARVKPDAICLPEGFPIVNLEKEGLVSEKDLTLLTTLAKKHKAYIISSIYHKRNGKIYNSGMVIDKSGKIAGHYDKIHPTEGEMELGVTPGNKNQIPIKTGFGKIGIQICFDANWHEGWKDLADKGAEIIFFPSAFPAGKMLESMALLNQVYIVPSIWSLHSGIIDNTGKRIIQTDRFSYWVWSTIDLERSIFHWDFQEDRTKKILAKYGDKVKIETFGNEAWFALEPASTDISIPKITKEFNLITRKDYLKRADSARNKYLR
ncbi:MAG: carbon-nitrogen hydrolase family protein [Candidatus Omnitrophica bacterium]|nr:carbon-nitrogen hydrolase family protein [Candidatus Omnitrophota bacterium]